MASVRQDIDVGLVAFVGIVSAMVLLIAVVGVQAWFAYETDKVLAERYEHDRNLDWIALKNEQYANIGDAVGNATIYADNEGVELPGVAGGYRFADEAKTTLVVPIHVAMAALAREHGQAVDPAAVAAMDAREYVHLKNTAYADPESYVEGDGRVERGGKGLPEVIEDDEE